MRPGRCGDEDFFGAAEIRAGLADGFSPRSSLALGRIEHVVGVEPVAPAQAAPERDIAAVIAEFRAYSREQARKHGPLSPGEIKEMIEEGRP